jgi:hypothetical protein
MLLPFKKKILGYYGCMDEFTDVSPMAFCFTTPEQINEYYGQLKLVGKLDKNSGTSDVYIVDKKRNLRVERKEGV